MIIRIAYSGMRTCITILAVAISLAAPNRTGAQEKSTEGKPADTVRKYAFPIRGAVYLDRNGNGTRAASEHGLEGIAVSTGCEVARTDKIGVYKIQNKGTETAWLYRSEQRRVGKEGVR